MSGFGRLSLGTVFVIAFRFSLLAERIYKLTIATIAHSLLSSQVWIGNGTKNLVIVRLLQNERFDMTQFWLRWNVILQTTNCLDLTTQFALFRIWCLCGTCSWSSGDSWSGNCRGCVW